MNEVTYRRVTEADLPGIHQVALASWHHTYGHLYEAAYIDSFVDEHYHPLKIAPLVTRANAGETFFEVATVNDQVVGFYVIGVTRRHAQMYRLYVLPAYIVKGVGRALFARGEDLLRARRVSRYSGFVHGRNELAKAFFLRQGFRHVEAKDTEEDWYMEKSLAQRDRVIVAAIIGGPLAVITIIVLVWLIAS
jgi:GNAT superfamily N-acetyltransferase